MTSVVLVSVVFQARVIEIRSHMMETGTTIYSFLSSLAILAKAHVLSIRFRFIRRQLIFGPVG